MIILILLLFLLSKWENGELYKFGDIKPGMNYKNCISSQYDSKRLKVRFFPLSPTFQTRTQLPLP